MLLPALHKLLLLHQLLRLQEVQGVVGGEEGQQRRHHREEGQHHRVYQETVGKRCVGVGRFVCQARKCEG